jgi:thiosulfate/3-mercaptopyruvate sulfurtransferase
MPERYRGDSEPIDPRAGHIPGAVAAPYSLNLVTAASGPAVPVMRSRDDLRAHYASLGVTEGSEPIVYCGSGITAAHNLLALHVAGFRGRLYAGSWSEWSSDANLPVATGEKP